MSASTAIATLVTSTLLLAAACEDYSTIPYSPLVIDASAPVPDVAVKPGDGSGSAGDAGADVDADGSNPCTGCLSANCLAECSKDTKCMAAYACVIKDYCWTKQTKSQIESCAIPCLTQNGISLTDPTTTTLLNVLNCAFASCVQPCNLTP